MCDLGERPPRWCRGEHLGRAVRQNPGWSRTLRLFSRAPLADRDPELSSRPMYRLRRWHPEVDPLTSPLILAQGSTCDYARLVDLGTYEPGQFYRRELPRYPYPPPLYPPQHGQSQRIPLPRLQYPPQPAQQGQPQQIPLPRGVG